MTFEKKLGLTNVNHETMYFKIIMDLIPNDWRHLATLTETSQKPLLQNFYYNNKDTRRVKNFLTKKFYNKPFKSIFHCKLQCSPDIWENITDWFIKCSGNIFSIWYKSIHFPPLKPCNR